MPLSTVVLALIKMPDGGVIEKEPVAPIWRLCHHAVRSGGESQCVVQQSAQARRCVGEQAAQWLVEHVSLLEGRPI